MKLVLKIAAGVFLGIVAVLFVYRALELWQLRRQQRLLAEETKLRTERTLQNMRELTPDVLKSRCGLAIRDDWSSSRRSQRFMHYPGSDGHKVCLEFSCYAGGEKCAFVRMHQAPEIIGWTAYTYAYCAYSQDSGHIEADYEKLGSPRASMIDELPCLAALH